MIAFKTSMFMLIISASVIASTPGNRTARGLPCFFACSLWDQVGIPNKPLFGGNSPQHRGQRGGGALIVLHGLGGGTAGPICKVMKYGMGLHRSVKVVCPQADWTSNTLLPPTWITKLVGIGPMIKSWYNMRMMPGMSTLSPVPGESKEGLEEAMRKIEDQIQNLINQGIPSRKIVLSGLSQGGSLVLYTALHTKYKLGGFIGIISWLPLLKIEPPTSFNPVNANTPLFHLNGGLDPIVPIWAGRATARELSKVIPDYTLEISHLTTHTTTFNPFTIPKITKWLKRKGLLRFGIIGKFINSLPNFNIIS